MVRQESEISDNKIEITINKFRLALTNWLNQKQTGKLSLEIDTNQGGIRDCHLKTDIKL